MAGNSRRKGAVRGGGSKKGAQVGSGGQRRKGLEAKGPTPPAEERVSHPAARRAAADKRRSPDVRHSSSGDDVVVGRNPVVEALRARIPATALTVVAFVDSDERIVEAVGLAGDLGIPVRERQKSELDRLAGAANHQGLVLQVREYEYLALADLLQQARQLTDTPLLVALDGITDPHNLGAIARSAAAFGARGLIVPSRRSAGVTPAAWRTSAGALAQVPVARVTNLTRAVHDATAAGLFAIGLDGHATTDITDAAEQFADSGVLLVIGSEGSGLSRLVGEACDVIASIRMPGRMESLNASVAAGVALHTLSEARAVGLRRNGLPE
jgi:23S rRNA (guanosine2251-2'-O)-methyltransferase